MENIIMVFLCLCIGVAMQRIVELPRNGYVVLNQYVVNVALPALTLYFIPKIIISTQLLYPLAVAWLGFVLSFVFFYFLGRRFHWSKSLTGCLILTAGLGNTSFIGFPIIQAIYGQEGLKTAIIVDQPGSFVVLSTLGLLTAVFFSKSELYPRQLVSKILFFPPFVAFAVASTMNILQLDFEMVWQLVFQKIGATVTPVALVAVGLQLQINRSINYWKFLSLGLLFKLVITPLFFIVLYKIILNAQGSIVEISIMESAMAPMITGAVVASSHGLKPKLSSLMVGIGLPLSFLTLTLWYWILNFL